MGRLQQLNVWLDVGASNGVDAADGAPAGARLLTRLCRGVQPGRTTATLSAASGWTAAAATGLSWQPAQSTLGLRRQSTG